MNERTKKNERNKERKKTKGSMKGKEMKEEKLRKKNFLVPLFNAILTFLGI